eukprot:6184549-Pleurochrysis_carterae.AAC.4
MSAELAPAPAVVSVVGAVDGEELGTVLPFERLCFDLSSHLQIAHDSLERAAMRDASIELHTLTELRREAMCVGLARLPPRYFLEAIYRLGSVCALSSRPGLAQSARKDCSSKVSRREHEISRRGSAAGRAEVTIQVCRPVPWFLSM